MVVDSLEGQARKEPHSLPSTHTHQFERDRGAQYIHQKPFDRMIIERSIRIWDV